MEQHSPSNSIMKSIFILIIIALIPLKMSAEWWPIGKNKPQASSPKVTLISDDDKSTVIKVEIFGFNLKEFLIDGKKYQSLDLQTEIFSAQPGFPEIPHIAKVLAIPDQAGVSVEIIETGEVEIFENINIQPARESWQEGQPESAYVENSEAYQSSAVYPAEYARVEPPAVFRDFRIARVSVYPIRYVASAKRLEVTSTITVRINYTNTEAVNPKTRSGSTNAIAPSFAALYRNLIFNYQNKLNTKFAGNEEGKELMLCIMPDEFVTSFKTYANWKRKSGIDIHITAFSDINANGSNPDIIKNHISDAYFNWEHPPTYVLIIGDDGVFPKKVVHYDYSFPSDNYFVEIDGNDFFPELMIGRFTNQGDYRMRVMINKYEMYEKTPDTTNTDWFTKGLCCSNNAYESQVKTKRFAAEMMETGGFTVDTLMSNDNGSGCSMDEDSIVSVLNEGRSWLNYRGEGWSYGWNANCYSFHTPYISSLNNSERFTFVTNIGCGVAMFSVGGGNCFGEEWVQLGSLSSPRGGIGFIGPTSNTHTTYNNKIDKGIYKGMFTEGLETPGQGLLRGRIYMYAVFGSDPWVEYHYRVYHVLGDPSLHIWKKAPRAVNVSHPGGLPLGYNQTEFTVTYLGSGLPATNAQVTLTNDSIFATGYTDSLGKVILEMIPENLDTVFVTARGADIYPYQDFIQIIQTPEHVGPDNSPEIVDIDGNTNGMINPGENCNITFSLKNWGTQTSNNVNASINSLDTNIQVITTNQISYGNLSAGNSQTGNPFQFLVKPHCPVGHVFTIQLTVTSNTATWNYQYSSEVYGCDVYYKDYVVNDDSSAVSNYQMEPGETVKLFVSVKNLGEDNAYNLKGILRCDDPFISIEDSVGSFGTLYIGAEAMNTSDYFEVTIDAACPSHHVPAYNLELYTEGGSYPYKTTRSFSIEVGASGAHHFTGPDAYGYYAYSNDDSIFTQAPVYDWFEIEGLGTDIGATGSEYTLTVNLPFTFKYYGIDYTELRINTDGWIAFGSGTQTHWNNAPLPNNDAVNNMVAVFWDDLYSDTYPEGDIYYYFDNANHRFIVEWDSIGHYHDGADPTTEVFQAILYDPAYYFTPTGDGEIIFQYKLVSNGASCTVGIENQAQDVALMLVYNNDYDTTATTIRHDFAVKFTTMPPFITLEDDAPGKDFEPDGYNLEQNHPNPFSDITSIRFTIPKQCHIKLEIYDVSGQLINSLYEGKQEAGKHFVEWNGLNNAGVRVSPGVYFYRFQTEGYVKTRKLFILR